MQASPATNEVRLPRAVLERSRLLDERIKARSETGTDPAPDAPPAPPSAEAATTAETDPPQPPAPPTDPRETDPAYWKQRFKVTEGVLRREREERIVSERSLTQRISELQAQNRELQASAPPSEIDLGQYLTKEQLETLGEEEAKAVASVAHRAAQMAVQKVVDAQIKPLHDQATADGEAEVRAARQRFVDKLIELVPDFEEVDAADGWKAWLAEDDPATGVQRQQLLNVHVEKQNAAMVARMFDAYKATLTPRPAPPVAPNGNGAIPSGELPPADPSALMRPTAAETRDFYKRAALGKVTDQERKQFEARLRLRAG